MPPKKKQPEGNKKVQDKQKQKVIEDKTFGLKNKKGKKQQQFIKQVEKQVKYGGNPSARKLAQMEGDKTNKKDEKKKELDELNKLFKPVQAAQKVSAGADPKSVLCAFFKNGQCGKGSKCKFSHDLSLERKSEKRSIYVDSRDSGTMEDWDQDQLENVVLEKHGEADKKKPKTEIICKHFLEAIDKGLYGWFWNCPSGDKCIYRHALPPGFVLKRKEKEKVEEETVSIEELIETERANLGSELTPVTLETFMEWKKKKIQQKRDTLELELRKKQEDFSKGKSVGKISGREMFLFKPELADEDDEEATDDPNLYKREDDVDEISTNVATLTLEGLAAAASVADGSGTRMKTLCAKDRETANAPPVSSISENNDEMANGLAPSDVDGLDQACAVSIENDLTTTDLSTVDLDGIPVDESLFEDDEDLDDEEIDQ